MAAQADSGSTVVRGMGAPRGHGPRVGGPRTLIFPKKIMDPLDSQLLAVGVPEALWDRLKHKLANSIFDAGNSFGFAESDDETLPEGRRIQLITTEQLHGGL